MPNSSHWNVLINGKPLQLKVLRNPKDHARGYQHQETGPGANEGLMFLFPDERPRAFHMRNVGFDLDLLGFDKGGKLVCAISMKAGGKKVYSTPPCKFIVEVTKGWCSELNSSKECRLKLASQKE